MPRTGTCSQCNGVIHLGRGSLPADKRTCNKCRRGNSARLTPCLICTKDCRGKYCSPQCNGIAKQHVRQQSCSACNAPVPSRPNDKRYRRTCSNQCRNFLRTGKWPDAGKTLVGPVERVPAGRATPRITEVASTRRGFVSAGCAWCGTWFVQDLRVTTEPMRYCSKQCGKRYGRAQRRALEMNADGTYTWAEVMRIYMSLGKRCAYCNRAGQVIEPDHVIPLSKGGSNSITNVVPCCKTCNQDKRAMLLPEWYASRKRRGLPPVELNASLVHLTHVALAA